MGPDILPGHTE